MNWTKEKPNKSGFYGFHGEIKDFLKNVNSIVEVKLDMHFEGNSYVFLFGTDETPDLSLFEGEWYGPLDIPE